MADPHDDDGGAGQRLPGEQSDRGERGATGEHEAPGEKGAGEQDTVGEQGAAGEQGADTSVARAAREVEEFVASGGWDQQVQLFALVQTAELLASQPELGDRLDPQAPLTPVAQESLPDQDLAATLAGIVWPDSVQGCAIAQEIVVLPPEAEEELPTGAAAEREQPDARRARQIAAAHPQRAEARLVAAVSRSGARACVLRFRAPGSSHEGHAAPPVPSESGSGEASDAGPGRAGEQHSGEQHSGEQHPGEHAGTLDEVVEHPELAPNMLDALEATLRP